MSSKSEFLESYHNCLDRIDMTSTWPFNESEIQPLYCDIWRDRITEVLYQRGSFNYLNPSILRSMLVMDLIDSNGMESYQSKIFDYYIGLLQTEYESDMFSLKCNNPKRYKSIPFHDYAYFGSKNTEIIKLLNNLLKCCYSKFQDIFADNGYETIGPIYSKNKTFVYYRINHILPKLVEVILFEDGIISGMIDMFGHCDVDFKNPSYVLLYDDELVVDENGINELNNQTESLKFNQLSDSDLKIQHIDSRIFRIKNNFNDDYISDIRTVCIESIENKPLHPRITNHSILNFHE